MQQISDLKQLMLELETNALAFTEKGNKAAARRARKALQEISKICKTYRKEISEQVKSVNV
jgi:DNA anti-recombination protein RmuC